MTVKQILARKGGEKITMLTAYDAQTASLLQAAGIDVLLVGDSLGTTVHGHKNTLPVSMDDMIRHARAVRRGAAESFIIVDMPFGSVGEGLSASVKNAVRLIKESGADAVKFEGGIEFAETVEAITKIGIPVCGHIGLKPQSVLQNGYAVNGKTAASQRALVQDAKALEKAGVFLLVIEGTTEEAARAATHAVKIPTIGIGAGGYTDGQVLVTPDMLGLDPDFDPKHNKKFVNLSEIITAAVKEYIDEVKSGFFPTQENTTHQS